MQCLYWETCTSCPHGNMCLDVQVARDKYFPKGNRKSPTKLKLWLLPGHLKALYIKRQQARKGIISLEDTTDPNHHEEVELLLDTGMERIMFDT